MWVCVGDDFAMDDKRFLDTPAPSTHTVEVPLPSQQRITKRQLQLLIAVRDYRQINDGTSPSLDDLSESMQCSRPAVVTKIQALIVKGLLTRQIGVHRSLRCTQPALDVIKYFTVPASAPAVAG